MARVTTNNLPRKSLGTLSTHYVTFHAVFFRRDEKLTTSQNCVILGVHDQCTSKHAGYALSRREATELRDALSAALVDWSYHVDAF